MAEKNERETAQHEMTESTNERLLEYGAIKALNVPVKFAPNNKPPMKRSK